MPMGSDESWAQKINERCCKYKTFEKSRFGHYSKCTFIKILIKY